MKRVVLSSVYILLLTTYGYASDEIPVLISAEEAALPDALDVTSYGFTATETVLDKGPEVKVLSPEADKENKSPVKVDIRFIPREGRDVDLSTLKVELVKFPYWDITSRVLPYASKDGIKAEAMQVHSGTHKIRLTIADRSKAITQKIFLVKVL